MAAHPNNFYEDGIIFPEYFNNQKTKVLFVGKEPNSSKDTHEHPHSFIEEWRDKIPFYKFSRCVADLSYGLLHGFQPYCNIDPNDELRQEMLKSISFINVKQEGGGNFTNEQVLRTYISENSPAILKRINKIEPTHIVFFFYDMIALKELSCTDLVPTGYGCYYGTLNSAKVITCYHPGARVGNAAIYALLKANAEYTGFTSKQ